MSGICPFAIWCPGPPDKVGYHDDYGNWVDKTHAKVGVAVHCAEYESTPEWDDYKTLHNALFSAREASWTFSICNFFGASILYQHYPIGTVCWAQGYQGNLWLDSIETERLAPHKLTEPQYALLVKTLRWIKEAHGWQEWQGIGGRQTILGEDYPPILVWIGWLFEHANTPGAPPTDCQVFTRGQIDPDRLLRDLRQEEDMSGFSEVQLNEMRAIIDKVIADRQATKNNWDGIESAARGAVADKALGAFLSAITGHWENLPPDVEAIQVEATNWHKWPES